MQKHPKQAARYRYSVPYDHVSPQHRGPRRVPGGISITFGTYNLNLTIQPQPLDFAQQTLGLDSSRLLSTTFQATANKNVWRYEKKQAIKSQDALQMDIAQDTSPARGGQPGTGTSWMPKHCMVTLVLSQSTEITSTPRLKSRNPHL